MYRHAQSRISHPCLSCSIFHIPSLSLSSCEIYPAWVLLVPRKVDTSDALSNAATYVWAIALTHLYPYWYAHYTDIWSDGSFSEQGRQASDGVCHQIRALCVGEKREIRKQKGCNVICFKHYQHTCWRKNVSLWPLVESLGRTWLWQAAAKVQCAYIVG